MHAGKHMGQGVAAATVILVAWALAGCSDQGEREIASMESAPAAGSAGGTGQRQVAQAMADCLADADLSPILKDLDDAANQTEVLLEDGPELWQICWTDGCFTGGGVGLTAAAFAAASTRLAVIGDELEEGVKDGEQARPWLIVGEEDRTDVWRRCEAETGYARPVYVEEASTELKEKEVVAQAGVTWAECARANGYPTTKDPAAPVADNWATDPKVVLPADVTPEQLKALIEVCPLFDWEKQMAADDALEANPELTDDEYWEVVPVQPHIGFDVPCQGGSAGECDDATWSKYNPHNLVIEDEWNKYLEFRNQ